MELKGFTGIQAPEPNTPVNQQASSSGQSTSLNLESLKPNLVINNTPNRLIGGKTGLQLSTWKSITPDSWILSQIEGVFPEFDSPAHEENPPQTIILSDTDKLGLALKNQQVISETKNYQENEILSNVFLRRTPNGTFRAILNLKPLNQFMHYTHFQMNSLKDAMYLVKEGYFFHFGGFERRLLYFTVTR